MTGWVVVCDDYTTAPSRTREIADRRREAIEEEGACRLRHRVEQVAR